MAYVGYKDSNSWLNNDGLYIPYGTAKVIPTKWGEYDVEGSNNRITEGVISLPSLPTLASANVAILADYVTIPKGALLEKVEIITLKETTGSNANLNIGLVNEDRSTVYDVDGILSAGDDFNGGTDLGVLYTYVKGTTDAGSSIGTVLTAKCLLTASADTADFTAGVIKVRVTWTKPLTADL